MSKPYVAVCKYGVRVKQKDGRYVGMEHIGTPCEVHKLLLEQFKEELTTIKERVDKVEMGQRSLENTQVKLEITLQTYGERFTKIEFGIDSIVVELKHIGTQLVIIQTTDEVKEKNRLEACTVPEENVKAERSIVQSLISGNHKIITALIVSLLVITLILLGVKMDDILKMIGK